MRCNFFYARVTLVIWVFLPCVCTLFVPKDLLNKKSGKKREK